MPITRDYNAVFGGSQTAQMPEQPSVGAQRFYGNGVPVNQGNPNLRLRTPDELRRYGEIRQSPDRGLLRSVWEWAYYDMGGLITQVWDEKAKMLMEHNLSASGEPMNDKEMMS